MIVVVRGKASGFAQEVLVGRLTETPRTRRSSSARARLTQAAAFPSTDIVIATPETVFQDKAHFAFGIVPGDGIHSLWPEVIGSIRDRTFVLTQQIIGADEAKTLGVISEIVTRDRLLHRAREIAGRIAQLPPLTASYTRIAVTQKLHRVIDESVGYGLALEGMSAADVARLQAR